MPLTIASSSEDICYTLSHWTVANDVSFIEALAWLYVQKHAHAVAVIRELEPGAATFIGKEIENAIAVLGYKISDLAAALASANEDVKMKARRALATRVAHRDGLLFQHISWLAARLQFPTAEATAPHVRQADKGFDGFLLEHDTEGAGLSKVILCEDKASTDPRALVTSQIWPEIRAILAGDKDREIGAAVSALLSNLPPEKREQVIAATVWSRAKHFRVALAAGDDQLKNDSYAHLFDGFDDEVPGDVAVRLGEVMPMPEVRAYLQALADKIIARLEQMKSDV